MPKEIHKDTKITFICDYHGQYEKNIEKAMYGNTKCPKCSLLERSQKAIKSNELFLKECAKIHNNKYDYSLTIYTKSKEDIIVNCNKHGDFKQKAEMHLQGQGCPKCGNPTSRKEAEINNYIKSLGIETIENDRNILNGRELDIVIPSLKIAIEYNGLRWHSEKYREKDFHFKKTNDCEKKGYFLLHIYEDDYTNNKVIVLNYIKHLLGKSDCVKIYARKTKVSLIDSSIANMFLQKNHIQGSVRGSFSYGTYHNNTLVAVAMFKKGSSNTKNKDKIELIRYASNTIVVGGLGKIITHYKRNHSETLYTFCDDGFFTGKSYIKAGFKKIEKIKPDYKYVIGKKREHKFNWRKVNIEKKLGIKDMTEAESMKKVGYYRIWDSGKTRYELCH